MCRETPPGQTGDIRLPVPPRSGLTYPRQTHSLLCTPRGIPVKRVALILATTSLLATALGTGVASAVAPTNAANLAVGPAGTKKAEATWSDWKTIEPGAVFDAYWIIADDDANFTPFTADRGRFVDDTGTRSVTFDDLNAGTTYYFAVYAVDYTNEGVTVVPPTGGGASTPIGYNVAAGSTLTINTSKSVVPAGKPVSIYGALVDAVGAPVVGAQVSVTRDEYPFGATVTSNVVTDADGKWSQPFSPAANTRYSATYTPANGIGGWTRVVTVEARKKISIAVDPGTTVAAGTAVKFTGTLGGDPAFFSGVQACLQRLDGKWGSLKCVDVDAAGAYLLKFAPGAAGSGKYRVFSGMGPAYGDSWSRSKTLTVN